MSKNKKTVDPVNDDVELPFKYLEFCEKIAEKILSKVIDQMEKCFDKKNSVLEAEIFSMSKKIDGLLSENSGLKKELADLKSKNATLSASLLDCEKKIDKIEQRELANCVNFNGQFDLPDEPNKAKIVSFIKTVLPPVDLKESNISDFSVHKSNGKANLKVKLDSLSTKVAILKAKKTCSLRNFFISESLTQKQYLLLQEAKRLVKLSHLHSSWSRNGSIFAKKREDSKPSLIAHMSDLQTLL